MGRSFFSRLAETARDYRLKSAFALLFVNLFFLALAGMNDWSPCLLLSAYWWEVAIIWFYSALKVAALSTRFLIACLLASLLLTAVPMYAFTYGIIVLGQCGRTSAWAAGINNFFQPPVLFCAAGLLASHGVSYYDNFWRRRADFYGEQADSYAISLIFYPLKRISGWLLVFLAAYVFAGHRELEGGEYFIAIFFKIIADFFTHLYLHRPSARDKYAAGEPV